MFSNYDIAGVTLASATKWLKGEIFASSTADLDTARKEIVFINEIGHKDAIEGALTEIVSLAKQGCKGCIAHAADPAMLQHLLEVGFVVALNETIVYRGQHVPASRLVCSPAVFTAWLARKSSLKMAQNLNTTLI